jgi:hypothetical protein
MRRIALAIALGAVTISAGLGVFALVGGTFGDVHGKILGTSLLVTAAASVALAAAVTLEQGRSRILPYLGIWCSIIGFGMLIIEVWAEIGGKAFWKTALSLILIAVAAAVIAILGLARLPTGRQWVQMGGQILAAVAAVLLMAEMWSEIDNEVSRRATGVVFVLLAGAMVAVPVLHGMADIPPDGVDPEVHYCPFCGERATGALRMDLRCGGCGRRFVVAV